MVSRFGALTGFGPVATGALRAARPAARDGASLPDCFSADCFSAVFFSAVFFILIGLDYWLPLALWMGMISQFIPTVGTYLAIALPGLIAILSDQPLDAVWVIIFATVYQQIENYYFAPRISARTMDIHPAMAFGSVIIGATLFGPIGALIGIPVAATVIAFVQAYTRRYNLIPELAEAEQ